MYVVCSVSYSILKPLIMSFCTQGLPGVAESNVSFIEGTPYPWGEGAHQGGWEVWESVLFWPSPIVYDGPPSPREQWLCWVMDSATSLSAPRRMTGVEGILQRVKVFVLEKPSIRDSGAMRIGCWCRAHWLLTLCALVVDVLYTRCWYSKHWCWRWMHWR